MPAAIPLPAIRRRVAAAGYSMAEFCKLASIQQSTLWRWTTKGATPQPRSMRRVRETIEKIERKQANAAGARA